MSTAFKVISKSTPPETAPDPVQEQVQKQTPQVPPEGHEVAVTAAPTGLPKMRKPLSRKLLPGLVALAAFAAAGWYGNEWYQVGRFTISTDDAYVQADKAALSPKLAGLINETPVSDNQLVHAGDVVMRIDDGDYKLAVGAADAKVASQKASIARIQKQLAAQDAAIDRSKAQLAMAQSDLGFAEAKLKRQTELASQKLAAVQTRDDAASAVEQSKAKVEIAQADLASALAQRDVIAAQVMEAQQALAELDVAQARAQRDLSLTEVRAPFDGIFSNRVAETGQYVQPGQRLGFLVPKDKLFVEANFKETDVAKLHDGQEVSIAVDALGETLHGEIMSIAPASGAEFSLLPPENATGNFTKVVQRVPVRISVEPKDQGKLRLGFSVTASVISKD